MADDGKGIDLEANGGRQPKYLPFLQASTDGALSNPFLNCSTSSSPLWQIRNIAVAALVMPLRMAVMACIVPMGVGLAKLATLGLGPNDYDIMTGRPLSPWRNFLVSMLAPLARIQLHCLGFCWTVIKGECAPKSEAPIIVANHVSGLVEGVFLWRYAKLAEVTYLENPLLKAMMLATQGLLVDRSDRESRHKAKAGLLRRSEEDGWPQTVVFPEATCTNGKAMIQFKLGAFSVGKPVQPVIFRYPNKNYDTSFTFPHGTWSYLLGLMRQFVNYMEVEYLPVYRPSAEEIASPALFAAGVQRQMAEALGVPSTMHASEDVSLCLAAKQLHLPIDTGLVQWQALSENLVGLHGSEAKLVLKEFAAFDKKKEGRLDFETFTEALRSWNNNAENQNAFVLREEHLRNIFNLLDKSGDGYIDFREYFLGVAVLNGYGTGEHIASLKLVFDSLAEGQSHFTKWQLQELLSRSMPTLSRGRLEELFLEADADGDGRVSREEFLAFAEKHKDDLDLRASRLLGGSPSALPEKRREENSTYWAPTPNCWAASAPKKSQ